MAGPSADGLTRTVGSLLVDDQGGILSMLVTTDYETFHSALTPIRDIAQPVAGGSITALYEGYFWLTGLALAKDSALFACDADGNVHTNRSGDWQVTPVCPGFGLRAIKCLHDGTMVTAGTDGIVYRLDGTAWRAVGPSFNLWINAIDGVGAHDFGIVGDKGLLAFLRDDTWQVVELPTDATLNDLLWTGQDYLACGANGALFRGIGTEWTDLSGGEHTLFGMAAFKGDIWFACGAGGVGQLKDDAVAIIRATFTAHRINASKNHIVFAGDNTVFRAGPDKWPGYRYD